MKDGIDILNERIDGLLDENKRLREALKIHNDAIDEIWKVVDYDQRLEELVEDAWVKYKEVMGDV